MQADEPPAKKPKQVNGHVTKEMAVAAPDSTEEVTAAGEAFIAFRATSKAATSAQVVPIKAINHIAFPCRKGEADSVIKFYSEVLGFELMNERPSFPFEGAWLRHPANIILHFAEEDAGVPLANPVSSWEKRYTSKHQPWFERRGRHIALEVDDLASAMQLLRTKGISYDFFPIPGKPGAAQLFFFDPLGNSIELGNYGAAGLPTLPSKM